MQVGDFSATQLVNGRVPSRATFIVTPTSAMMQWKEEILNHTEAGALKVWPRPSPLFKVHSPDVHCPIGHRFACRGGGPAPPTPSTTQTYAHGTYAAKRKWRVFAFFCLYLTGLQPEPVCCSRNGEGTGRAFSFLISGTRERPRHGTARSGSRHMCIQTQAK